MGCTPNITPDRFPKQGSCLGKHVWVCFNYDTASKIAGKIVRDDVEAPGLGIIQLENGWVVLMTECQYSFR